MKLCIVLHGATRFAPTALHALRHFAQRHEVRFFLSLTRDGTVTDLSRFMCLPVERLLLSSDASSALTRILPVISAAFDIFLLVRTDAVFQDGDAFLDALVEDVLYVSPPSPDRWPPAVMASRSYLRIKELAMSIEAAMVPLPTAVRTLSSTRRVVAVAGDSGAGKSTLCAALAAALSCTGDERVDVIETDGYHRWDRGDARYGAVTHLDPYANDVTQLASDMMQTRLGDMVAIPHYDHVTGKRTPGHPASYGSIVFFCGLHTVQAARTVQAADVTVFLDADRVLVKRWKMARDVTERGYAPARVEETMRRREDDYLLHVDPQKEDADIVVRFQASFDKDMECCVVVQNADMVTTLLRQGKPPGETIDLIQTHMIIRVSTRDAIVSVMADILRHVLT